MRNSTAIILTVLSMSASVASLGLSGAEAEESRIDSIYRREFGDKPRRDVFDEIEKSIAERSRAEAERAARESETRELLLSIRQKIFDIELRITRMQSEREGCAGRTSMIPDIEVDLAGLQRLRGTAMTKCGDENRRSSEIDAFCRLRIGELDKEIDDLDQRRKQIVENCITGTGRDAKEAPR